MNVKKNVKFLPTYHTLKVPKVVGFGRKIKIVFLNIKLIKFQSKLQDDCCQFPNGTCISNLDNVTDIPKKSIVVCMITLSGYAHDTIDIPKAVCLNPS
jgi:hypothetical protein